MKNGLTLLSVSMYMVLIAIKFSNADLITSNFCIVVDEVDITLPWEEIPDEVSNIEFGPHGIPGETFMGTITYDDTIIPEMGSFTEVYSFGIPVNGNPGMLSAFWESPFLIEGFAEMATLNFLNAQLIGFSLNWHPDISFGLDDETITEETYQGFGQVNIIYNINNETFSDFTDMTIRGIVHFQVSEPGSLLPSIFGIIIMILISRRRMQIL